MAIGHAHRRNGAVEVVDARLHRLEIGGGGQSGGGVAVQVNGDGDRLLQAADQFEGRVGGEQAGHVLDA